MTVLEAFNELGLAQSQHVLDAFGRQLSRRSLSRHPIKKYQFENGEWIYVNDYNDTKRLKHLIILICNHSKLLKHL